jgi:hypothetical protein
MSYNTEKQTPESTQFGLLQLLQQNFTLNNFHQEIPQNNQNDGITKIIKIDFHICLHLLITLLQFAIWFVMYVFIYYICYLVYPFIMLLIKLSDSNSNFNFPGIISFLIAILLYKGISRKTNSTMNKPSSEKMSVPIEEEIVLFQEETKEKKKNEELKIKENREEYWKQRDALLNQYEGKYIAFSNGKVLGCSDDPYEIATYIEKDPTIFTTLVGKEKKQSTVDKVLLLDDLKLTKDRSKTCFPYHEFEQQIIDTDKILDHCGWCGENRTFVSFILTRDEDQKKDVVGTFLIDTGAPTTYVQKSLLKKINATEPDHVIYSHRIVIIGISQLVLENTFKDKFEGINLLGADFLKKCGYCILSSSHNPRIFIPYDKLIKRDYVTEIQYK